MSPKSDSGRSPTQQRPPSKATGPAQSYSQLQAASSRRSSTQPKSSRQQFSACGACRMRRVRCDLKDLQAANPTAGHTACSNCQERGLKCVDEFAEVKAVKLLRRGRRLQQVEAVYGKAAVDDDRRYLNSASILGQSSTIPKLRPEFFRSSFFHSLLMQRPIIDPFEFQWRVSEAHNDNPDVLGVLGQLLCMVLAIWATSFGINEAGEPEPHSGHPGMRRRQERTKTMLLELLQLIDVHGLLRKPTWDGVRVLLLVIPLTEDVHPPLERLAMYEATINQVYTLCSLASVTTINSGQGEYVDAVVRARIFWYAHVHEGVTTGLRGGRLLLSDDDLNAFQTTLLPVAGQSSSDVVNYSIVYHFAKTPIRLSTICRQVHAALTGPKARQRDQIDARRLREAWDGLEQAWEELEDLRQLPTANVMQPEDVNRFVNGWQIMIFECHNVIREALKQRLGRGDSVLLANGNISPRLSQATDLHSIAEAKCYERAHLVTNIIRRQLGTTFFQYDASLVRDGCFFAGMLLARSREFGTEEDVTVCIRALREMRWAFSKSEEREQTLKMLWDERLALGVQTRATVELRHARHSQPDLTASIASFGPGQPQQQRGREPPPPLSITHTGPLLHDSAPSTAVTEDGGWATLSNPSSHTPLSHRSPPSGTGSPPFLSAPHAASGLPLSTKVEAIPSSLIVASVNEPSIAHPVYYAVSDMDTFAYSIVPTTTGHDVHDLTPPRSSAGMSSSSVTYHEPYYDPAGVFTSPPGTSSSARASADPSGSLTSDDTATYHTNYPASHYYVTQ